SQIFQLQSSLLEEDVTWERLRECVVWFLPSHLEDIIIEKSEAEGICGWPLCRTSLSAWERGKYRIVVNEMKIMDREENAWRYCSETCMS
ncbi:unnamed protein product, partial [Choristocarpus tenellus]